MDFGNRFYMFCFLTLCTILLMSCESDENLNDPFAGCYYSEPTYLINESDKQRIISYSYELGDRFVFKSQSNDSIVLSVYEIDNCPKPYFIPLTAGFSFSNNRKPQYTFESNVIRFQIDSTPVDYDKRSLVSYFSNSNRDLFYAGLRFPLLNDNESHFAMGGAQYYSDLSFNNTDIENIGSLTINGVLFEDVRKYATGSNNSYHFLEAGDFRKNIKIIYFTEEFGIVRFDDTNDNQYELVTDLSL